jgi:hypothetical protein
MKTINDLYAEITRARDNNAILAIQYSSASADPFHYPTNVHIHSRQNIISIEFKPNTTSETMAKIFEHLKTNYGDIVCDIRLVSATRINIYTPAV